MMKMVVSVAASSLRKALVNDREGLQNLVKVLKQYVHSDLGVNLCQYLSNEPKTVQKILANYPDEPAIIWQYEINKSITDNLTDPREPFTADEFLHEIRALPQIVEITYCKRHGVDNILFDLKKLSFSDVNVPTDTISRLKQKSAELKASLRELHQKHEYKLHSFNLIRKTNFDLKMLINEKPKTNSQSKSSKPTETCQELGQFFSKYKTGIVSGINCSVTIEPHRFLYPYITQVSEFNCSVPKSSFLSLIAQYQTILALYFWQIAFLSLIVQ